MNRLKTLLLLVLTGLFCGTAGAKQVLLDRLVAEVNGEPVMYSEVIEKVEKGPLVVVSPYPAKESDRPFDVALQDLINLKLVMQKATEMDIDIKEEQVNAKIDQVMEKRNMTKADLLNALAQESMTYDRYKEDVRKGMILEYFQGRVILPQVKVTDRDVEIFYMRQTGENSNQQFKMILRQIYIKYPPDAGESIIAAKKELASRVYKELEGGMNFADAAKVYSDNEGADKGGLMAPIYLKDLGPEFRKEIEGLKEKSFSKPIYTASGIYLFYLDQRVVAGDDEFLRKKQQMEYQLRQEEVVKQTMKWIEDQRNRSKIKIITDQMDAKS